MVQISELCDAVVDCVNKTAPVVEGPTPYRMIRTTNVRNGRVDTQNVRYVDEATYKKWSRRGELRVGDIILTREAPLGEVGLLRQADGVFLGQRLVMYRADPKRADNRFLAYALQSPWVQAEIQSLGSGSTVSHMRVPDCERILVPNPPLNVQRRIGESLGAFDELIENNRRRIEILEETAQRIYREWFVHFRFPGHESSNFVNSALGSIPESWRVQPLSTVLDLAYGKALKSADRQGGDVAVYGSGGIVGWHNQALVDGPGIVVGRKGNVGAVYWSDGDFYPIDTTYFVKTKSPLSFVYHQLQTLDFLDSHAAVPGLSRDQAYGLNVVVPTKKVIEDFDEIVSPMYKLRRNLIKQNKALTASRDFLLPRLISGEVDVPDLDPNLESVG